MRVLVVTTWFPSAERPGVAPFNLAHAAAIARNHDVDVVHADRDASGPARREEYAGLPVTRLPVSPRAPLSAARNLATLRRLLRGADVVHSMAFSSLLVLAPLWPLIRTRWVHTEHWSALVSGNTRVPAAVKQSLRLPSRVSTVSAALWDAVRPLTRDQDVTVVPNVISDHFAAREQPPWDPLKLVSVGMLVDRKRPVLAVETVAELIRGGQDATLTWVGDGPLREAVAARAGELRIADRVTVTGTVPVPDVAKYLSAGNMFFLPTEAETFLVAAAEAIASGRPVVLPRLACLDYVTDSNGVLVSGGSAESFAHAIIEARDTFRHRAAADIRSTVIPRFGEQAVAECFDRFYAGLRG